LDLRIGDLDLAVAGLVTSLTYSVIFSDSCVTNFTRESAGKRTLKICQELTWFICHKTILRYRRICSGWDDECAIRSQQSSIRDHNSPIHSTNSFTKKLFSCKVHKRFVFLSWENDSHVHLWHICGHLVYRKFRRTMSQQP